MTRAVAYAKVNLALVVGPRARTASTSSSRCSRRSSCPTGSSWSHPRARGRGIRRRHDRLRRPGGARARGRHGAALARPDRQADTRRGRARGRQLGRGRGPPARECRARRTAIDEDLRRVAGTIGADVPFFLCRGPQLATGDGTELRPLELPDDYVVLLVVPYGAAKVWTGAVYDAFDERVGPDGFEGRADAVLHTVGRIATPPISPRSRETISRPRS